MWNEEMWFRGAKSVAQGHVAGKGWGWDSASVCVLSGLFPADMSPICEVAQKPPEIGQSRKTLGT